MNARNGRVVSNKSVHFSEWAKGANQLKFVTRGELVGVIRVILERRLETERRIRQLERWYYRLWRWLRRKPDLRASYEAAIMHAYYGLFSAPGAPVAGTPDQPPEIAMEERKPSGLVDLEGNHL